MNKQDILKIVFFFFVALLIVGFVAGSMTTNTLYQELAAIAGAILLLLACALGAERGTELVKIILRFAFSNLPFLKNYQPNGAGSMILALLVSIAGVYKFDISIFNQFPIFANLDPNLIHMVTTAVLWVVSSIFHDQLPEAVKAQPVKTP